MGLRVTTTMTGLPGGPWLNVFSFVGTTLADATGAALAADAFWQACAAQMATGCSLQTEREVVIYNDSTGQPEGIFTTPLLDPNSSAGGVEPLPWATQMLVSWRTGVFSLGREIRGRTFIPGLLESQSASGRPSTAIIGTISTAVNNLVSDPSSQLAVHSRRHGTTAIVQNGTVWNQWATLRTRRD